MKKLRSLFLVAVAVASVSTLAAAPWKPMKTIELVAPAGPGGGWDMLCRVIQKTLVDEKLVNQNVIVTNKPGGGGAVGWTYLQGKKGQGEILAATSTLLIFNKLLGTSQQTYKDFTPIAALQSEWEALAVSADSPYKSLKDVMEAIKANPGSMPIGIGPSLGNDDHVTILELAKAYGIPPASLKFIVYPGAGGEIVPAVLGGHVKLTVIGVGEVREQHKAGKMRILGVSSPDTLSFLPDVKTFTAQGVNVVFPHWRGLIGAPGLSAEQIAYWDGVFAKMVQTKTWQTQMDNLGSSTFYQNSAEHARFLAEQSASFDELLTAVGLKK
ncbi:MAG TPA: tripartite tricarboxylate transporter substrate-binding protein [Rectinemataceae bacterium]|nr:tripartite tricarboxylate transporter substrate-binding protein [Rectinemataceae bacterium]